MTKEIEGYLTPEEAANYSQIPAEELEQLARDNIIRKTASNMFETRSLWIHMSGANSLELARLAVAKRDAKAKEIAIKRIAEIEEEIKLLEKDIETEVPLNTFHPIYQKAKRRQVA